MTPETPWKHKRGDPLARIVEAFSLEGASNFIANPEDMPFWPTLNIFSVTRFRRK